MRTISDKQVRVALFEVQRAIGFALLHLEDVEFFTEALNSSAEEKSPPIG